MKKKIFLTIMLLCFVLVILFNSGVFATTETRLETLDLTAAEFSEDQKNDNEGWAWEAIEKRLTLKNVDFQTATNPCIILPDTGNITIELVGENTLTTEECAIRMKDLPVELAVEVGEVEDSIDDEPIEEPTGSSGLVIQTATNGSLILKNTDPDYNTTIAANNLTIESGTITSTGGQVYSKGNIMINGGHVTIAMDEEDMDIYHGLAASYIAITGEETVVDINVGDSGMYAVGTEATPSDNGLYITDAKVTCCSSDYPVAYIGSTDEEEGAAQRNVYIQNATFEIGEDAYDGIWLNNGTLTIKDGTYIWPKDAGMSFYTIDSGNEKVDETTGLGLDIALLDYANLRATMATIPENLEELYTEGTVGDLQSVLDEINDDEDFYKKNIIDNEQSEIDTVEENLREAIAALEYKDADYTEVDGAIEEAGALDEEMYVDFSMVTAAVDAVEEDLKITEQEKVNSMATAIRDAIAALEYKDADYTEVDAAIANSELLKPENYEDFTPIENAISSVVRDKKINEQEAVDKMAEDIINAIKEVKLKEKDADYTKVEEAIKKIADLVATNYSNYAVVEDAIKAVDYEKKITEQEEVDNMAKMIEDAIEALEPLPADYTKVDEEIAKANALAKDQYKDFTAVESAVSSVARDKNILQQEEVDNMAKAIKDAVKALEYKDADYTKVDEAIAKVNKLKKDEYKNFGIVTDAVNAVVRDKNITEQAEVDNMAKTIEDAVTALKYKDADYTKVDEAIKKANELKKDQYKDFTVVTKAINSVVRNKNITEQEEVDKMTKAIEDAVKALEYKDADYTKVDNEIKTANELKKDQYKDFSAVENAIKAVVRGKNITEQEEVDAMQKAIKDAIFALVYKDADYTKVDEAIKRAEALNKEQYKDFSAVTNTINAVDRTKNITEQAKVDSMAVMIESAVKNLQYKDASYTKVDSAIAKANALNKDQYKDFSAVTNAVNAVVRDKNISEQENVDKMVDTIENAIKNLQYKDADYTKVDEAIKKANALKKDEYKDFTAVTNAIKAVVRGKNITEQAKVDSMATTIENAIKALQPKNTATTNNNQNNQNQTAAAAQPAATNPVAQVIHVISPKTGDQIVLYVVVLLVSGIGAIVLTKKFKANKKSK